MRRPITLVALLALLVAVLPLVYGLVLALLDSRRRSLLTRQIGNLATAKARSVAVELAELSARAVPAPGASSTEPIIRIWYERSGENLAKRTRADRFYLDDGTGLMLIDPAGAKVGLEIDAVSFGMHQVKLKAMAGGQGLDVARLMPGGALGIRLLRQGTRGEGRDGRISGQARARRRDFHRPSPRRVPLSHAHAARVRRGTPRPGTLPGAAGDNRPVTVRAGRACAPMTATTLPGAIQRSPERR